jgi:hypothetical protein
MISQLRSIPAPNAAPALQEETTSFRDAGKAPFEKRLHCLKRHNDVTGTNFSRLLQLTTETK